MPEAFREALPAFFNTLIIYVLLIVGVRTLGRRQTGQLTALDLLVVLLLGSAVETALIGPSPKPTKELFHDANTSLPAGMISAGTLLLVNYGMSHLLRRSRRVRRILSGGALLLVHGGKIVPENLRRAGMTEADLLHALRSRGYISPEEAHFAIMEGNGEVHVLPSGIEVRTKPPARKK